MDANTDSNSDSDENGDADPNANLHSDAHADGYALTNGDPERATCAQLQNVSARYRAVRAAAEAGREGAV
jgi:hypothetical protein